MDRREEAIISNLVQTVRVLRRQSSPVRIGVVLSGGGLRGASHVGVLEQLTAHQIPIDIIVGSSAGAVIAAYYAAVGLTIEDLIRDAAHFRGRHLLAHSLNVRLHGRAAGVLRKASGVIPARLAQLDRASFDRLHHGVRAIGIVCHDRESGRPCYFATRANRGVRLSDAVRASASMPYMFPPISVECSDGGAPLRLCDGGVSDSLPIAFAQQPPLAATHLVVSDCRSFAGDRLPDDDRIVYVRPRLSSTGTLRAPVSTLASAVREGGRAVTNEMLHIVRGWLACVGTQPVMIR